MLWAPCLSGGCTIFRKVSRVELQWVAALLAACGSVMPALASDSVPFIEFTIKPRLCVLSEGEEMCQDELEIAWTSETPRSLCLFRSDQEVPIRCWEDQHAGAHRFAIEVANDVDFHLREADDDMLLVSQAFEVVHDNTQYRRRRRNPWSFF